MGYSREYHLKNKDRLNANRRNRYDSEARKTDYRENRESILLAKKEDRANCPLCQLDYRRLYIPRHLVTRHKLDMEEAKKLCQPC